MGASNRLERYFIHALRKSAIWVAQYKRKLMRIYGGLARDCYNLLPVFSPVHKLISVLFYSVCLTLMYGRFWLSSFTLLV